MARKHKSKKGASTSKPKTPRSRESVQSEVSASLAALDSRLFKDKPAAKLSEYTAAVRRSVRRMFGAGSH